MANIVWQFQHFKNKGITFFLNTKSFQRKNYYFIYYCIVYISEFYYDVLCNIKYELENK